MTKPMQPEDFLAKYCSIQGISLEDVQKPAGGRTLTEHRRVIAYVLTEALGMTMEKAAALLHRKTHSVIAGWRNKLLLDDKALETAKQWARAAKDASALGELDFESSSPEESPSTQSSPPSKESAEEEPLMKAAESLPKPSKPLDRSEPRDRFLAIVREGLSSLDDLSEVASYYQFLLLSKQRLKNALVVVDQHLKETKEGDYGQKIARFAREQKADGSRIYTDAGIVTRKKAPLSVSMEDQAKAEQSTPDEMCERTVTFKKLTQLQVEVLIETAKDEVFEGAECHPGFYPTISKVKDHFKKTGEMLDGYEYRNDDLIVSVEGPDGKSQEIGRCKVADDPGDPQPEEGKAAQEVPGDREASPREDEDSLESVLDGA